MAVRSIQGLPFSKGNCGVAVVEMLFLLVIFVVLFGLTFGFWTSIHRGILQSIAARHYAFEVINHRTHFIYHRDTQAPSPDKSYYQYIGHRFFAVVQLQNPSDLKLISEKKELSLFNRGTPPTFSDIQDNDRSSPIRLKVGYGICIDFACGPPTQSLPVPQ